MTKAEIMKITAAEYLAEAMLTTENGYHEVNPVCIEASEAVQNAIKKLQTTSENFPKFKQGQRAVYNEAQVTARI